MKLVRHKVRDFYALRIDEIYSGGSADPFIDGNRVAVKELGLVSE